MKKWWIYLVFLLVLVSVSGAQYFTGGSEFSILDFYFEHPYEIDFFIFLLIFLGLAKAVFKDRFKEQSNLVAVGIGVALALALVLWEHNSGKFLLSYGSIGITLLVLLVIFVIGWAFLKFFLSAIFPSKRR